MVSDNMNMGYFDGIILMVYSWENNGMILILIGCWDTPKWMLFVRENPKIP